MKEIVIGQAQWVFIGDVEETDYGLRITNATCVRNWGTTAGLGETALRGPTPKTVLDHYGTVKLSSYVARIECHDTPKE